MEQTETGLTVYPLSGLWLEVVPELQELGNSALVPAPQKKDKERSSLALLMRRGSSRQTLHSVASPQRFTM
jgi:hypothetical protein